MKLPHVMLPLLLACAGLAGISASARAAEDAPSAPAAPITRQLGQDELHDLLVAAMNQQLGDKDAELELNFSQPWKPLAVPAGPLTVEILEPAPARLGSASILRFELHAGAVSVGSWQLPVQAKLWREVWVAHEALTRGASLTAADIVRERRDILAQHGTIADLPADPGTYELAGNVPSGAPLTAGMLRLKPVFFRGQLADAVVQDGGVTISLKVEVLEEGAPGQIIRVCNPQSHRELWGKIQDEHTISISL
jgi:flagella basal body P-ring formation protein FlgA